MTDKIERLLINKLPRGGYALLNCDSDGGSLEALAAFSEIDDALAFIKDELGEPETVEQKSSIVTTDVTREVFPSLPVRPTYRGIV